MPREEGASGMSVLGYECHGSRVILVTSVMGLALRGTIRAATTGPLGS